MLLAQVEYFADNDGPASKSTFEGAVEALAQDAVASAEELEAIIDHFHDKFREQGVTEPELIAARMYTGPGALRAGRRADCCARACGAWHHAGAPACSPHNTLVIGVFNTKWVGGLGFNSRRAA